MDINQLRAFDVITRQGNFSRAARTLNISQPTISMRIQAKDGSFSVWQAREAHVR